MGNIDEAIKRTDELFKKIIEIAKEKSGTDYLKYVSVYMTLPGAESIKICKGEYGEEVWIMYKGYDFTPTSLMIREGKFSLGGYFEVDGNLELISLYSDMPEKAKDYYYDVLNKFLNNIDTIELTYDKEKTTAITNPIVKEHLLEELIKRCRDMHLSDVGEYPTIQTTADFYSLILADYFVSEGKSIVDNQEIEKKISVFRDHFSKMIAEKMTQDPAGVNINCSYLLRDYKIARKYDDFTLLEYYLDTPLPASLRRIGISLDDFMKYYEENWDKGDGRYTVETTTTLADASPIGDIKQLVLIPSDIREKLEKLSYKIITYVRENDLFTNKNNIQQLMLIMMRFWHWSTPIIKDLASNGYSIPNDDEVYRIVTESSEYGWGFVNLLNTIKKCDSGMTSESSSTIK